MNESTRIQLDSNGQHVGSPQHEVLAPINPLIFGNNCEVTVMLPILQMRKMEMLGKHTTCLNSPKITQCEERAEPKIKSEAVWPQIHAQNCSTMSAYSLARPEKLGNRHESNFFCLKCVYEEWRKKAMFRWGFKYQKLGWKHDYGRWPIQELYSNCTTILCRGGQPRGKGPWPRQQNRALKASWRVGCLPFSCWIWGQWRGKGPWGGARAARSSPTAR